MEITHLMFNAYRLLELKFTTEKWERCDASLHLRFIDKCSFAIVVCNQIERKQWFLIRRNPPRTEKVSLSLSKQYTFILRCPSTECH